MTEDEWWEEFGECPCEACQESTEIQSMRADIIALRANDSRPPVGEKAIKPSLF